MITVSLMSAWLVLCCFAYRQVLICANLAEQGRIDAPVPSPILMNRATKQFFDFVLKGKFRTSPDRDVLRDFSRLRFLLVVQLSVLLGAVACVLAS